MNWVEVKFIDSGETFSLVNMTYRDKYGRTQILREEDYNWPYKPNERENRPGNRGCGYSPVKYTWYELWGFHRYNKKRIILISRPRSS